MRILYHISDNRFIVNSNDKYYMISCAKRTSIEVTADEVESVLRQGYWEAVDEVTKEKREELSSLIS